jgi:hypothetical protein
MLSVSLCGTVFDDCGDGVDKLVTSVGITRLVVHTKLSAAMKAVHNYPKKPELIPLTYCFLCTVYRQFFIIFSSVIERFVHIIHSAYKYHNYVNKGLYL